MKRVFLIIFVAILFTTCHKDDVVGPSNATTPVYIFPLSTSNKWIQSETQYDSLGNIISTHVDSLQFQVDTIISNVHWLHSLRADNAFANLDSGMVIRLISPGSKPDIFWQYKYPASKGDRYPFPSLTHAALGDPWFVDTVLHTTVLSIDSIVSVPAGTFHCIVYQTSFNDATNLNKTIDFLSPGFGTIRSDNYQSYNSGRNIYLRMSFVSKEIIIK